MKYDIKKILADLKGMDAPYWLQNEFSGLDKRRPGDSSLDLHIKAYIAEISETVGEAENSPLNGEQTKVLEKTKRSLEYLEGLLHE